MALLYRLGIFIVLLVIAVVVGFYLGKVSVSDDPIVASRTAPSQEPSTEASPEKNASGDKDVLVVEPPLFFYPGKASDGDWKVVSEQVVMAAAANIHRYVVTITPGWFAEERDADSEQYTSVLEQYVALDNQANFIVWVNLNPPVRWFEQHPEAAMRINDAFHPYPCPASAVWREAAAETLSHLISTVELGVHGERIAGYVLSALQEQRWLLPEGYDVSKANQQGFQQWLRNRYKKDDALRAAWGTQEVSLSNVKIPARPNVEEQTTLFLDIPAMQPVVDFQRYCSESVADALAGFAADAARTTAKAPSVIIGAPYGHSYEATSNDSGHFGLGVLLESDLNMLMSPVSYVDRGLGGVGGLMGPVDSMLIRGKHWYLVDDTRTGVERDPASGEFARIRGINAEDVFEVQRRNFAMALTYRLGLVWADPQGEGWLHDAEQWKNFGKLNTVYAERLKMPSVGDEQNDAVLTVVVDESSRFYMQCDGRVNGLLLQKGRDAALRSSVSLRFHLLRDVIEDIAPPTSVYLFLNAFHLSAADRSRLHARLAREQASAIWLYAPGFIADGASAENIAATTGMDVRQFEGPFESASAYLLSGQYLKAEEKFGGGETWNPAFYIEPEEDTDFLAHYVNASDKGSIGILTLPEGWTSVYVAEPGLTPALLCELLQILEQHLFLTPVERAYYDALFVRDDIVALHASQAGKRSLYFGGFCDIEDLIDSSIGWQQKDSIMMPVRNGETRLLRRKPIQVGAS